MSAIRSLGSLALACAFFGPGAALAQPSNFGAVGLGPGFQPDPTVVAGRSGGQIDASTMGGNCRGWISANPDHILHVNGRIGWLRIFAEAMGGGRGRHDNDTTLVIQTPNGRMMCDDDTYGLNPAIEGRFHAGTYRIWIGSYSRGDNSRYQLHFTELRHVMPGGRVAQPPPHAMPYQPPPPQYGGGSNFGVINVYQGFQPDPMRASGTSGGMIQASTMSPQCRGWISSQPDHLLTVSSYLPWMRIYAESDRDVTLVIRDPNGQIHCDDDTYGRNPALERGFGNGTYQVWIGSYSRGDNSAYTLTLTELRHVQPGAAVGYQPPPPPPPPNQFVPPQGTSLDLSGRSRYGNVEMFPGFQPDPMRTSGTSGGYINASQIAQGCSGWISPTPNHVYTLRNHFRFFRIFVNAERDTTLIVRGPDGRFYCNDDANGRNPVVDQNSWRMGTYHVWVGSYRQNYDTQYNIGFTELNVVQ